MSISREDEQQASEDREDELLATIAGLRIELTDARSLIRILAGYTDKRWLGPVDQRHIDAYRAATQENKS